MCTYFEFCRAHIKSNFNYYLLYSFTFNCSIGTLLFITLSLSLSAENLASFDGVSAFPPFFTYILEHPSHLYIYWLQVLCFTLLYTDRFFVLFASQLLFTAMPTLCRSQKKDRFVINFILACTFLSSAHFLSRSSYRDQSAASLQKKCGPCFVIYFFSHFLMPLQPETFCFNSIPFSGRQPWCPVWCRSHQMCQNGCSWQSWNWCFAPWCYHVCYKLSLYVNMLIVSLAPKKAQQMMKPLMPRVNLLITGLLASMCTSNFRLSSIL